MLFSSNPKPTPCMGYNRTPPGHGSPAPGPDIGASPSAHQPGETLNLLCGMLLTADSPPRMSISNMHLCSIARARARGRANREGGTCICGGGMTSLERRSPQTEGSAGDVMAPWKRKSSNMDKATCGWSSGTCGSIGRRHSRGVRTPRYRSDVSKNEWLVVRTMCPALRMVM